MPVSRLDYSVQSFSYEIYAVDIKTVFLRKVRLLAIFLWLSASQKQCASIVWTDLSIQKPVAWRTIVQYLFSSSPHALFSPSHLNSIPLLTRYYRCTILLLEGSLFIKYSADKLNSRLLSSNVEFLLPWLLTVGLQYTMG